MTSKDFRIIADIISKVVSPDERDHVAIQFAHFLAQTNPRFDRSRFLAAAKGQPLTNGDRPRIRDYKV